jgi:phytoene dehydrogenase-like protein
MSASDGLQVVVIGAGLAGLACAADLAAAGLTVAVVEASDSPGGRMRTDRQAGFLLDRGFQVFNTSYPQVRRRIDLRALRLRPFTPGMLLNTGQGRLRFTDPTRQPGQAADLLPGRLAGPRDLAAAGILSARDMLLPARLIRRSQDRTTLAALARAGISADLTERLFRPFLAGAFLEDQLETSSRFFHFVWRFVCGDHRATGSVQGALASGARAAREILARPDQGR